MLRGSRLRRVNSGLSRIGRKFVGLSRSTKSVVFLVFLFSKPPYLLGYAYDAMRYDARRPARNKYIIALKD